MKDVVLTISEKDKDNLLFALGMATGVCSERNEQALLEGICAAVTKIISQLKKQNE